MKLHLGCGTKSIYGHINVDRFKTDATNLVHDLETPWPWLDNSVDEIYSDQLLEHIKDLDFFMKEAYRVLKPGGIFNGYVPYAKSDWAFIDPTHCRFFIEETFNYWCGKCHYVEGNFILLESRLVHTAISLRGRIRALLPFKSVLKWFLWNMYDNVKFKLQKPLK